MLIVVADLPADRTAADEEVQRVRDQLTDLADSTEEADTARVETGPHPDDPEVQVILGYLDRDEESGVPQLRPAE